MSTRIDDLGLADKVNELRKEYSYNRIAKIINEKYLPEGEEPISQMTVHRYFKKQNSDLIPVNSNVTADEVDPYDELKALIDVLDLRLERLSESLKEKENCKHNVLAEDKDYRETVALQERLISRKQNILNDISKYQSEIGTYQNMKEIIRILVETLRSIPGAYEKFRNKIDTNVDLKNLCR